MNITYSVGYDDLISFRPIRQILNPVLLLVGSRKKKKKKIKQKCQKKKIIGLVSLS